MPTLGIVLSILSFWTYAVWQEYWVAFYLYLGSIGVLIVGFIDRPRFSLSLSGCILALLSIATLFQALDSYPFALSGDAVRDGGLHTTWLVSGKFPDPFGWGKYNSHGLIIPALNIPFYHLFNASALAYRVPSAVLSCASLYMLYAITSQLWGRKFAWVATLTLLANAYFLFFSRSETVIAWSIFLSVLMMACYHRACARRTNSSYYLLSLIIGFSGGFHAGVRPLAALILVITLTSLAISALRSKIRWATLLAIVLNCLIFLILGFGPRLFTSTVSSFIKLDRNIYSTSVRRYSNVESPQCTLGCRYFNTLERIVAAPVSPMSQSPIRENLVGPVIFQIGFIVGCAVAILHAGNSMYLLPLISIAFLSLTNSAITNLICADHRMAPLYPMIALVTAFGFNQVLSFARIAQSCFLNRALPIALSLYLLYMAGSFFYLRLADRSESTLAFLLRNSMSQIRNYAITHGASKICLFASPSMHRHLTPLHVRETLQYFVPEAVIEVAPNPDSTIIDPGIQLAPSCTARGRSRPLLPVICSSAMGYRCSRQGTTKLWVSERSDAVEDNSNGFAELSPP